MRKCRPSSMSAERVVVYQVVIPSPYRQQIFECLP
uniref:Uncharacterized protein n=1 Tax=Anguilla anguilla TaxID=7936 RepID=A0A0E9TLM4_ANGAN